MIYVETISLREFRGIRNLTIPFKVQNFAICGPNGTGKSGIVDALEFVLTGSISRLSGKGTGSVSVKEHAPHVDSRNRPDKAGVVLTGSIPSLGKTFSLERKVKTSSTTVVTPNDPDVLQVLRQVSLHPEFALSRRELIRYVISAPGDRAKEVQALLRLDEVETVRAILQKIMNSCQREVVPLKRERDNAQENLSRALEIADIGASKVLAAVNARRGTLGLGPIAALTPTTSLKDGLAAATEPAQLHRVPKVQATADTRKLREVIALATSPDAAASHARAIEELTALNADPAVATGIERERFLQSALNLIEGDACPVCDTRWDPDALRRHIGEKLQHLEEIARRRAHAERLLEPIITTLDSLHDALRSVAKYSSHLKPPLDARALEEFRSTTSQGSRTLENFLPLPITIATLQSLQTIPVEVLDTVTAIEAAVDAIPEPSEQDAARDYLTVAQERLEAYRGLALRHKQAEERAALAKTIYETYAKVSTDVLNGIYRQVEERFSTLYRLINHEDERNFTAHLTPSIGKLGFDVDFYGRGMFPPGAYHSEGHQDGMGLCLYLALMKHLLADSFTFAVLDDVLMSIDAGHRREVCTLLKRQFPTTQFILTTHDEIWLRHMKTAGLISPHAFIHFRNWDVDHGPTEWDGRDVWDEITDDDLRRNDVRAAAALLRHYLEFVATEICHRLRARVEFRGDAQYQLGDLLPAAAARFRSLLKEGKAAAESWGHAAETAAIAEREKKFETLVAATQLEKWQINPAIHYNEWANFQARDFAPVVEAYRGFLQAFTCSSCGGLVYVVPERGLREELRCACGVTNINLLKKKAAGAKGK